MNKERLMQHRALAREEPKLRREIDKLYERLENVPVVSGKVTKSSDDFPYIEEHLTVQMTEPNAAEQIRRQIQAKERRLRTVETELEEIRTFVDGIEDATIRQIFEMSFLEGKKQREIAEEVGYSRSRISQIISDALKD